MEAATQYFFSVAEVRSANKAMGHHFFDSDTLRFFDSRIGRTLYGGRYFITSEQFSVGRGYVVPRRYTVRVALPDGSIDTVGDFQQYPSHATARSAVVRSFYQEEK